LTSGHVTFGCLNNFMKVTDGGLSLWSKVLKQVPTSRLLLLSPAGSHRRWVLEKLGVDPARVEFVLKQERPDYFATYSRIDICLDTIPYNGHTTSLDAFWMGVPVITLRGSGVVGRGGWSLLNNLGMPELAAKNPEEFASIAAALAADVPRLAQLRPALRPRMEQSVLMDGPRFARNMESAFRQMWVRWCQTD
jgi:predicted O-linked N-acetylglucosamine transferase (SPINDLY family)